MDPYHLSPLEVHHGENTLDFFLKEYSNEGRHVKKQKFNVGETTQINRKSNIFEKRSYL